MRSDVSSAGVRGGRGVLPPTGRCLRRCAVEAADRLSVVDALLGGAAMAGVLGGGGRSGREVDVAGPLERGLARASERNGTDDGGAGGSAGCCTCCPYAGSGSRRRYRAVSRPPRVTTSSAAKSIRATYTTFSVSIEGLSSSVRSGTSAWSVSSSICPCDVALGSTYTRRRPCQMRAQIVVYPMLRSASVMAEKKFPGPLPCARAASRAYSTRRRDVAHSEAWRARRRSLQCSTR